MKNNLLSFLKSYNSSIFYKIKNLEDVSNLTYFDIMSCFNNFTLHCGGIKNTANLLFHTGITGKTKILEVGCGTGATTNALLSIGLDVTVVEPSKELISAMLKTCISNSKCVPSYYNHKIEDSDNIKPEQYDIILLECVFGFIQNKEKAIYQINRLLKPNGIIAITDFNYHTEPPKLITKEIKATLQISEILFKQDWEYWLKSFKNTHWEIVEMAKNEIDSETIQTELRAINFHNLSKQKQLAIDIIIEKFKYWNYLFKENKKYMTGFNAIWQKTQ